MSYLDLACREAALSLGVPHDEADLLAQISRYEVQYGSMRRLSKEAGHKSRKGFYTQAKYVEKGWLESEAGDRRNLPAGVKTPQRLVAQGYAVRRITGELKARRDKLQAEWDAKNAAKRAWRQAQADAWRAEKNVRNEAREAERVRMRERNQARLARTVEPSAPVGRVSEVPEELLAKPERTLRLTGKRYSDMTPAERQAFHALDGPPK